MDAVSGKDRFSGKMLDEVVQKTGKMVFRTETRRATTEKELHFSQVEVVCK